MIYGPESSEGLIFGHGERRDLNGWRVASVPREDLDYLEVLKQRQEWDAGTTGAALEMFRPVSPGERTIIVGRKSLEVHDYARLFNAIDESSRPGWGLVDMSSRYPGEAVTMQRFPTPDELKDFIGRHDHRERNPVDTWSLTGDVPYIVVEYGDKPGEVALGMMDVNTGLRTEAPYELPV